MQRTGTCAKLAVEISAYNADMRQALVGSGIAFGISLVFAACRHQPLRIVVAHGFSGTVEIDCLNRSSDYPSITVGWSGLVRDASCPIHQTEVLIFRDDVRIEPEGPIVWKTTGDGVSSIIQLTIR
jgi:hypothetical protein